MATATELLDELTEEILFRIHPADAATLVRAALVCKRWCRLIGDPGFRRRLRERHREPHMLGFSTNIDFFGDSGRFDGWPRTVARFVRTSPCLKHAAMDSKWSRVVDTRHGRVLLHRRLENQWNSYLIVWDPITKDEQNLPLLPLRSRDPSSWNAAVFCTAAGCDHLDCHGKPFAVVFIATGEALMLDLLVYSSEAGRWRRYDICLSDQQPAEDHPLRLELDQPSVLVGNALYFMLKNKTKILRCIIGTRELHTIGLPPRFSGRSVLLMAAEDGGLGFATVEQSKLHLWSAERVSERVVRWAQRRVVDLETLLPMDALETPPDVVGYAFGVGFIFLKTHYDHFRIDLKSSWVKKVRKTWGGSIIFPYMSFHTPALGTVAASKDEGPSMGASSA